MADGSAPPSGILRLRIDLLPDPGFDAERAERSVRQLRGELGALEVMAIHDVPDGVPPDGAKGADPVTVGAVIVALSASGGVFTAVIGVLQDWLSRHSGRHKVTVTIGEDTIELERATAEQQRAIVDAFVQRHSTP